MRIPRKRKKRAKIKMMAGVCRSLGISKDQRRLIKIDIKFGCSKKEEL
tara:strand:- start:287 stop:430 length:144 start_codon:yes stop_codon:yes gene_type:complete